MDANKLANLKDLRTEAVEAFEAELVAEFGEKRSQELTVEGVTELTELSTAINAVRAELQERRDAEEAEAAKPTAEELAAAADAAAAAIEKTDEPTPEPAAEELASKDEDDEKKDEKKEEAKDEEAVSASADEAEPHIEISPSGLEGDTKDAEPVVAAITAGADVPGRAAGSQLPDFKAVAEAFIARRKSLRGVAPAGDGDDVIVATVHGVYPEERVLSANDAAENEQKIKDVASQDAITASGGLCAPLEPYYGIQVISQASRPVRDALPKFNADRGGVRFLPPPVLSDLDNAIGVTTASDDAGTYGTGGGDTPFKPCLHVTCGNEQTEEIYAVHRCLTFGNFSARTYPEQVQAWLALALASHARRAESLLLDAIDAASTQTTGAASYSAIRTLLPQLDQAIAAYRSRNRTGNLSLRVLLPDWVKELVRADLARGFREDRNALSVSDAEVVAWFTARGVNVTFYLDSANGEGQIFGAQAGGALTPFPTTVVWYLFVEGSFVFLDGGTLDLGLVRDSTLNSTNDYQIFAETFEGVAFYGIESIKVTSTVCPSGVHSPAATGAFTC